MVCERTNGNNCKSNVKSKRSKEVNMIIQMIIVKIIIIEVRKVKVIIKIKRRYKVNNIKRGIVIRVMIKKR